MRVSRQLSRRLKLKSQLPTAPVDAISDPIIGPGIGGAGIGFASTPLIVGAGVAAAVGSAFAVSEAANAAVPATPVAPVSSNP